jgi:hypothetical protein
MEDETKKGEETTESTETGAGEEADEKDKNILEELGDSVGKFASKTMESIKHTIDRGLTSRNTVMTIRVTDEANKKLSMLVDAGVFKSRSESAAFLIEEGIKGQDALFKKIEEKLETIEKLKEELRDIASAEMTA